MVVNIINHLVQLNPGIVSVFSLSQGYKLVSAIQVKAILLLTKNI